MHTQVDTQPDRGVKIHDVVKSAEKWYGVFLRINDESQSEKIQEGLELILTKEGYLPPKIEGDLIYSKGHYSNETVEKIEKYLASLGSAAKSEPVITSGTYDDFLGDRWLNKLKGEY